MVWGMLFISWGSPDLGLYQRGQYKRFEPPESVYVNVTVERECYEGIKYRVELIDFKEYVKGVLPNEWLPRWKPEALKAGAVAVKMFAWAKVEKGYRLWDCTWSQVYDPTRRTDETDQAVEDTWGTWLLDEKGNPVMTLYNADIFGCYERGPNCMNQIGSQSLALDGMNYEEILMAYYDGNLVREPIKENKWLIKRVR